MRIFKYDSSRAAEILNTLLEEAFDRRGKSIFAVPGGRSPGPVISILSSRLSPRIRNNLYLLWVDERAVPPGHLERNDRSILASWKEGGELPAFIYPMPAEDGSLERASRKYSTQIEKITSGGIIDVCLLGVGEDGHIASLFPGHAALDKSGIVLPVYDSPKPPSRRLTLSLETINRARFRVVLAPGEEKTMVFRRAEKGARRSLPASLLETKNAIWFVD